MTKNAKEGTLDLKKTVLGAGVSLGILLLGAMMAALMISGGHAGEGTSRILMRIILLISVFAGGAVSCFRENRGRGKKALLAAVPTALVVLLVTASNAEAGSLAAALAINLLCVILGILLSAFLVIKGKNKRRRR